MIRMVRAVPEYARTKARRAKRAGGGAIATREPRAPHLATHMKSRANPMIEPYTCANAHACTRSVEVAC
eukprot:6199845-Pleurochrysis_carterae.AAC.1